MTETTVPPPADPVPTSQAGDLHQLLKERSVLFDEILAERDLGRKTTTYLLVVLGLGGFYGAAMGSFSSLVQAVASAVKVPLLLVGVMLFCLPALYIFNVLLASRISLRQVTSLLSMSSAVMSVVLAAFAPITLFCVLTGVSYDFFVFENVVCFTIAGIFGLDYLWAGTRTIATAKGGSRDMTILAGWMVIYVLLGSQLAWSMRPFIGSEAGDFHLLRGVGGNFFDAVWDVMDRLLG